MSEIEHRLTKLEEGQVNQGRRLEEIEIDIKGIVKMLSERPTWFTAAAITILTTITCSLIVYVATL